jgi:hypothetical protein
MIEKTVRKALFFAALFSIVMPCVGLAGTYDALCNSSQKCEVKIADRRLIVGDKIVPIEAISSWTKSGPGRKTNSTAMPLWSILVGSPLNLSTAQWLSGEYQSIFNINYYTTDQKLGQLSVAFVNEKASRFFEVEIQATTGLPQGVQNENASQFKWNTTDYSVPRNTNINP